MPASLELYLVAPDGSRWRVYDVAFGPPLAAPHKRRVLPLGDGRARYRLFVPPDPAPMVRIHDFGKAGGDRGVNVEVLTAQLAGAQVSPKKRTPATREPPGTKLGQ